LAPALANPHTLLGFNFEPNVKCCRIYWPCTFYAFDVLSFPLCNGWCRFTLGKKAKLVVRNTICDLHEAFKERVGKGQSVDKLKLRDKMP